MSLTIKRLAHGLGARVDGLDPRTQSKDDIAEVRAAWLEHQVLVLSDMEMTPEEHIALTRPFGELELHPDPGVRGTEYPELFRVTNAVTNGKRSLSETVARGWHSDGAYTNRPPTASLLHCRALPKVGGTTWFANQYLAYETLSPALKEIVEQLYVVNNIFHAPSVKARPRADMERAVAANPPVVHKVVRVHPETGRKALYLNELVSEKFDGWTEEESEGLLKYLFAHSTRPEFVYRHDWRLNDVVMWDNRCTVHFAPADYDPAELRDMWRSTLKGEPLGHYA